jgi:CheY-like chemotaxis protein
MHGTPSASSRREALMVRVSDVRARGVVQGRILLAEDDYELRRLIAASLRRIGCDVVEVSDGLQLVERVGAVLGSQKLSEFDVVISDIRMPGWSGLEVLEGLKGAGCSTPVILITAFGDDDIHRAADRAGAVAVFDKPFDIADLGSTVCSLLREAAAPGSPPLAGPAD